MLRIYQVMLDVLGTVAPLIKAIKQHDPNLADQLRRAGTSVVLNLAEGSGSFGGVRRARYRTALGSARESLSCLQVAEHSGYIPPMPPDLASRFDHVIGTLVRVSV
jgi:four helix bundle protein